MILIVACNPTSISEEYPIQTVGGEDLIATPFSYNSISPSQEDTLVSLLKTYTCVLPCYMNITPGKTNWNDAEELLKVLGANSRGAAEKHGEFFTFGYSMLINDDSDDRRIFQDLSFLVSGDTVQQIFVSTQTHAFTEKFEEYWSRYSPEGLFVQLGIPDAVYLTQEGHGLAIVYEAFGVVATYNSFKVENSICPKIQVGEFIRHFMFTNVASSLSPYFPFEDVSKDTSRWLPIEESLGISTKQFYENLLTEPAACFELIPTGL